MIPIKTAFFGSPTIAANLLESLLQDKNLEISLVITQPDKPVGKRLEFTPTKVKQIAVAHGIELCDKEIRDKAVLQHLHEKIKSNNFELGILYAYGALIPQTIIDLFPQGIWNVHPSLLPHYRGPSPTAYPLLLGDLNTGVTIMKLVKQLDAGPIIAQKGIPINSNDTRDSLEQLLTSEGSKLITHFVDRIAKGGHLTIQQQDSSKSTYTRLLKKEDGYISPDLLRHALLFDYKKNEIVPEIIKEYMIKYDVKTIYSASEIIWNMYRAFSPWPGIWTTVETNQGMKRLKLNVIHCTDKNLKLQTVQLEGKKEVDFETFNRSYNFITAK